MREIRLAPPVSDYILLDKQDFESDPDEYFLGVETTLSRGFITKESPTPDSKYTVRGREGITAGSGMLSYDHNNLKVLIKNIIDKGYKVYSFPTYRELFLWLAEEKKY